MAQTSQETNFVAKLIDTLRAKKYSIGFAESCTGGLLSATIAAVPGVSDIFRGSIISYASDLKVSLLGVSAALIEKEGAVSEQVAQAMANGARQGLKVDCAVAVSGIAGPSGGSAAKPVGTVCFAISGPGFEKTERKIFSGSRQEIQAQAVQNALRFLLQELTKN